MFNKDTPTNSAQLDFCEPSGSTKADNCLTNSAIISFSSVNYVKADTWHSRFNTSHNNILNWKYMHLHYSSKFTLRKLLWITLISNLKQSLPQQITRILPYHLPSTDWDVTKIKIIVLYLTIISHYNTWNVQYHCRQYNLLRNWPSCTSIMIIKSISHFMCSHHLLCTHVHHQFKPQVSEDQWYNVLDCMWQTNEVYKM